jgi:hypothetical protein
MRASGGVGQALVVATRQGTRLVDERRLVVKTTEIVIVVYGKARRWLERLTKQTRDSLDDRLEAGTIFFDSFHFKGRFDHVRVCPKNRIIFCEDVHDCKRFPETRNSRRYTLARIHPN